jgi:hypothetical protein
MNPIALCEQTRPPAVCRGLLALMSGESRHAPPLPPSRWVKPASGVGTMLTVEMAAHYLMNYIYYPFGDVVQEEFVVLLLDSRHVVRYEVTLYRGTINSIALRPAEVFRDAIGLNAFAILATHNHPFPGGP